MSERRAFRRNLTTACPPSNSTSPPLRARPEDIPLLIDRLCAQKGGRLRLTSQAMEYLQRYTWQGNVASSESGGPLAGVLRRGADHRTARGGRADHRPAQLQRGLRRHRPPGGDGVAVRPRLRAAPTLADQERAALEQALAYAGGNRALAARLLGISRTALFRSWSDSACPELKRGPRSLGYAARVACYLVCSPSGMMPKFWKGSRTHTARPSTYRSSTVPGSRPGCHWSGYGCRP